MSVQFVGAKSIIVATAGVALMLLSGCISVDPKSQTVPLSTAQPGAQFQAPVAVRIILSKDDEDLRDELADGIAKAFTGAHIAYNDSAESYVELTLNRFRRVSRLSRSWNGHFAGAVEYDITLRLSNGESVRMSGDLGMKYGYSGTFGKTTADGIDAIARMVASETAKRLKL